MAVALVQRVRPHWISEAVWEKEQRKMLYNFRAVRQQDRAMSRAMLRRLERHLLRERRIKEKMARNKKKNEK